MARRINVLGRLIEYDVGVVYDPGSNRGVPKILDPGTDDLSKETKSAVVKNASDITHGNSEPDQRNRYPVGAGYNEIALNDVQGNPLPLDSATNTSERTSGTGKQFVETRADLDSLKNYSNSTVQSGRTLKVPGTISPTLKKGKQALGASEHDGNTLLKDGIDKIQETYVSPILSNNRFTATGQRTVNSAVRINPNHPDETKGSYRAFRESVDGRDVNDGHFANIGALLTVRATSELMSDSGYGQDGPDGAGASAASLLPGTAQIGLIKVDVEELRAMDAFKSLMEDDTDPVNLNPGDANDHLINDFGSSSFGQMNNVLEPFSGLLPLGMIAASSALVIGMKLALKGLTMLLAAVTSAKQGTIKRDAQGRFFLGHYIHSAGSSSKFPPLPIPAKLLGLTDTSHDFEDCVDKGIEQVFGGGLGNSFERVLETPGFYGVLCRTIVRSAANIVIQVQNAVKGNPIQVAQNIIELINVIRSSKVISAINVMAKIGDTVLVQNDKAFQKEEIAGITKYSLSDALPNEFRVGKGRQQGKLASALENSATPSAFLFPREFMAGVVAFSNLFPGTISAGSTAAVRNGIDLSKAGGIGELGKKIPDGLSRYVETQLEAEYVPFYFHDLRTNEIISFHAFLRSLSDEYNVETESMKAIGRVDPVKIYKSTDRKISIEFYCVATNKQDFDQMWWKINKIHSLVYPQWTRGDVLESAADGVKFTQPFSQMPSNSPLFRLRLGDLFRSNYSKFGLARLFGLGQRDTFFNVDVDESVIDKLVQVHEILSDPNQKETLTDLASYLEPGEYVIATDSQGALTISIGKSDTRSHINLSAREPIIIRRKDGEDRLVVELTERDEDNIVYATMDSIHIDRVELAKLINRRLGSASGEPLVGQLSKLVELSDFMKAENNSIVRSFESSSGKGLACMIDNLGFNFLDNIPWETEAYGSRAPKMCLIKMSLTPIHDIAPGLDANGFNRAPVYNVGEIMNGIAGDSWDDQGEGRTKFDDLRKKVRKVLR